MEPIPDYGPYCLEEIMRNDALVQARVDGCDHLPNRRWLCAEIHDVNRRFRNANVSTRFLAAMLGDLGEPHWGEWPKPSFVKALYN